MSVFIHKYEIKKREPTIPYKDSDFHWKKIIGQTTVKPSSFQKSF